MQFKRHKLCNTIIKTKLTADKEKKYKIKSVNVLNTFEFTLTKLTTLHQAQLVITFVFNKAPDDVTSGVFLIPSYMS